MKDLEKVREAVKLLEESGVDHLLVYKKGEQYYASNINCTAMDGLQAITIITKKIVEGIGVELPPKAELIEEFYRAVTFGVDEGWENRKGADGHDN